MTHDSDLHKPTSTQSPPLEASDSSDPSELGAPEESESGEPSRLVRFFETIGRWGNRLPDPLTFFLGFCVLVFLASALFAGTSADIVQRSGDVKHVVVESLFTIEGIAWMFQSAVANFIEFAPLGSVLVVMLGIGLSERVGLMAVALRVLVASVPSNLITATLVFGGVMSSMANDAGYVVLTPLGALIFASVGRHPLAGLAAAYAGVSGGFSANLLVTGLDPMLSTLTQQAARIVDPNYVVYPTSNYYLMFVSTFVITIVGTLVTTRIVEPMLGKWDPSQGEVSQEAAASMAAKSGVESEERRAFFISMATGDLLTVALLLLGLIPGAPLHKPLAPDEPAINALNPFFGSIEILITIAAIIPAIVYGILTKQITNDKDFARLLSDSMRTMASYVVLAFFAGQFIAYFNHTNLGAVFAVKGATFLGELGLSGVSLILGFMITTMIANLFVGSASAKWAFMAPIFVPMLMMDLSPELTQATYRIGDSVTNIISPLLPYLPVIITFAQKYDRKAGMGTLFSAMLPYSIAFFLSWSLLLLIWFFLELPLGPGASLAVTAVAG